MSDQLLVKVSYASDGFWDCPQAFLLDLGSPLLGQALQQIPVQRSLTVAPMMACFPASFHLVDRLPHELACALQSQDWLLVREPLDCSHWLTELEQVMIFPKTGTSAILCCHPKHTDIRVESVELPVDLILNPAVTLAAEVQ